MSQTEFNTMCATVFAPDGSFDESAMRRYLRRRIDARFGIYLGGNGEIHAVAPGKFFRLYGLHQSATQM
jgi:hypothetical protein